MANILVTNISEMLTLAPANEKEGRRITEKDLGIKTNQAMYIVSGRIEWLGAQKEIPKILARNKKIKEVSMKGQTLLPGFVECHTHLVFAGHRAEEFELRNQGVSYQEISKRGGGILSTLQKTRAISERVLFAMSQKRVDDFVSQGVTTLEIKSGYSLDLKNEIKMLGVINKLRGPRVVATFLGAHAKPPEFASHGEYLKYLSDRVLPKIKKLNLASRVDIFVEKGFFEPEESRRYLAAAKDLGFDLVVHADQLTLSGGANLCIELGARSGDHLLQIRGLEINKLARSNVTCVLLPAADLYMKCAYPPARKLIDAGARVALATDFNPGTCPTQDVALVGLLARLEMKMTLPEVIAAYTVGASYALNLAKEVGSLEVGKYADFLCTNSSWQETFYSVGGRLPTSVYRNGQLQKS